jgi:hypothetical protein
MKVNKAIINMCKVETYVTFGYASKIFMFIKSLLQFIRDITMIMGVVFVERIFKSKSSN